MCLRQQCQADVCQEYTDTEGLGMCRLLLVDTKGAMQTQCHCCDTAAGSLVTVCLHSRAGDFRAVAKDTLSHSTERLTVSGTTYTM